MGKDSLLEFLTISIFFITHLVYEKNFAFLKYIFPWVPIVIAALFAIAKMWKQNKCTPIDERVKKNVVHRFNGILFSPKKEGNPVI